MASSYSCSDDEYSPGEPSDPNSIAAFFPSSNPDLFLLKITDNYEVKIKISRLKTDKAVTVPLKVLKKDEALQIPASAEFPAGEAESEITITFPSAEPGNHYFSLLIEGKEFVDQYAIVDGFSQFDCTVNIEKWDVFASDVIFQFADFFEPQKADILKQEGVNRYKIVNYLSTGHDFIFSVGSAMNIIPEGGRLSGSYWYFSSGKTPASPTPISGHEGKTITDFFIYIPANANFSFMNIEEKKGCFYHYNYYNNGGNGYIKYNFTWE